MKISRAAAGSTVREVDAPVGVDDDAVERRPLERDHLRRLLLPMRLEQLRLDEMAGELRQPARIDRGDAARVEARRLDQLGGDDPAPGLLRQARARMAPEADAARAEVRLVLVALDADVAEQAGEHRLVQLLVGRLAGVDAPAVLGDDRLQLRVDVAPLAHAARRDEVVAQQLLVLARREPMLAVAAARLLEPPPQLERAEELRLLVVELRVRLVGGLLLLERPVADVLDAERAGDDQHLAQRLAMARLEDHPADARIERQARELAADRRQRVLAVGRAELVEQLVAVGDRALRRRLEEREVLDAAEVERLHAQDDAGERRADDLRVGELRSRAEVGLVVEADADAVGDAPAAAGALVRRGLADRLDRQLLDLAAKAVALDPRRAGVDDEADAGNGERGLGDVGGEDDAARAVRREHLVLLLLRQAREQRQHLDAGRMVLPQPLGGVADLALAGQEDEHVARAGGAGPCQSSSTASQIASPRSWSRLSTNGRQRISTG